MAFPLGAVQLSETFLAVLVAASAGTVDVTHAGGADSEINENVPAQGLGGEGKVSNQMKYSSPAVSETLILLLLAKLPILPTQVPPEVGHP